MAAATFRIKTFFNEETLEYTNYNTYSTVSAEGALLNIQYIFYKWTYLRSNENYDIIVLRNKERTVNSVVT